MAEISYRCYLVKCRRYVNKKHFNQNINPSIVKFKCYYMCNLSITLQQKTWSEIIWFFLRYQSGYRFTKGLTRNFKLMHTYKAWMKYKIPQLYPTELFISTLYWTQSFTFFDMINGLKVIKIWNDYVTLHFA